MRRPQEHPARRGRALPETLLVADGRGSFLIDTSGRRYLDTTALRGAAILGYGDKRVVDAMTAHSASVPSAALPRVSHDPAGNLARRLVEVTPDGLDTVLLLGESVARERLGELALLLHRLAGQLERSVVLDLRAQPSFGPGLKRDASATSPHRSAFDAIELELVRELVHNHGASTVGAIVLEPVRSDTAEPSRPETLRGLRELCDETGALLVFDETRLAPGRTGATTAAEFYSVCPDILALAGGLAAGYAPLGALLIRHTAAGTHPDALAQWQDHWGDIAYPAACAAALTTLSVLEADGLPEKALEDGARLREGLRELAGSPATGTTRGIGLLAAIDLIQPLTADPASPAFAAAVVHEVQTRGVLVRSAASTLIFTPPLVCTPQEIETVVETISESITAAAEMTAGEQQ